MGEVATAKDVSRALYEACWHSVVNNLDLDHLLAGLDDVTVGFSGHVFFQEFRQSLKLGLSRLLHQLFGTLC